ncbi:MAG: ATP-binding protein, partial [Nitrospirota bacterium]
RQNMRELKAKMDELKSTQAQLIHSAKLAAIGELAGHIAHEINNPLTSVLGYTSLLIETETDSERKKQLNIIEGEGLRARDIVKKLLDFAHQIEPKRERVDIKHIIEVVLSLVTGPAGTSNIAIKAEYTEGLPDILVDVSQIEQVFLNIINNSMDAMPDGGILTVKSFLAGGYLAVSVSDTGRGIEAKTISRIFEPFFTTKDKVSGAGLGLSVSLGIIERHGGKIDVESSVGEGTKFTVRLPINQVEA